MQNEVETKIVSPPKINDRFGKLKLLSKKQSNLAIAGGLILGAMSLIFVFGNKTSKVRKTIVEITAPVIKEKGLPLYDLEKDITKPVPKKKKRRRPRVVRYGGPTVISRPLTGEIRPGTMLKAKLVSGASDGMVKAVITEAGESQGAEVLPPGSVFIGSGKSQKNRLYITFTQIIFPDGNFHKISAVAADFKDKIPGLKGSNINHYGTRLAASAGLNFVAGVSDGLKDRTVVQGATIDRNTLKNAALNGSTQAAIELSKQMLAESRDEEPKIEKEAGTMIYILFDKVN